MKINTNNEEKIEAALVMPRARARTIDYEQLMRLLTRVEHQLARIAPKKAWVGCEYLLTVGDTFPASYKGDPQSTFVEVVRGASAWFVVDVSRRRTVARDIYPVQLPDGDDIVKFLMKGW